MMKAPIADILMIALRAAFERVCPFSFAATSVGCDEAIEGVDDVVEEVASVVEVRLTSVVVDDLEMTCACGFPHCVGTY